MNFFSKIKLALSKTASKIISVKDVLTKKKIDATNLEELSDQLILADFGIETSNKIINILKSQKFDNKASFDDYLLSLKNIINGILYNSEKPLTLKEGLNIHLVCGVNGNGKTTTIAKMAHKFQNEMGKKVALAACDTFRAAAIDQLKIWSERISCPLISGDVGSDPASVAYKSVEYALKNNIDILIIDTAGRLHNQHNLMAELEKIIKVIKKLDETSPHEIILTLDSTTGQNLFNQLENFSKKAEISGLVMTKLDGTAKGGAIIGMSDKYKIPIYYLGIGEKIDDLIEFKAEEFTEALF